MTEITQAIDRDDVTFTLNTAAENGIFPSLMALGSTALRANQMRDQLGKTKLVACQITLRMTTLEVSEDERRYLGLARLTGFEHQPPFEAPEEVRLWFTRDALTASGQDIDVLLASAGCSDPADVALRRMGDVLMKTRHHCEF